MSCSTNSESAINGFQMIFASSAEVVVSPSSGPLEVFCTESSWQLPNKYSSHGLSEVGPSLLLLLPTILCWVYHRVLTGGYGFYHNFIIMGSYGPQLMCMWPWSTALVQQLLLQADDYSMR